MIQIFLILASLFASPAQAQCNGVFGSQQVCGSVAGGIPAATNFSSFTGGSGGGITGGARISFSSWVAFGDSITVGTGASIPSDAYVQLIAKYAGLTSNLTNQAVGGAQACDWNNQQVFPNYNPGPTVNNLQTVLIGTNDAQLKHAGAYEAVFNQCFLAAAAWLTIPAASGNATYKVFGNSNGTTTTGSWSADTTYQTSFTAGNAANVLSVSAISAGAIAVGQLITGTGVTAGTYINAQPANTNSFPTTWNVTPSQSVSSTTMTASIGLKSTTNGSTWSAPLVTYGNPVFIWYRCIDTNGGTFTWNVDGGANHSVNAFTTPAISTTLSSTQAVCMDTYTTAAGSHTINLTVTSATSGSNIVSVIGIGTPANLSFWQEPMLFAGGVIQQFNNANPTDTTAYNTDVKNNVTTLTGYGLPVFFVNTQAYVNSSIGMADSVHPNDMGNFQLYQAFSNIIAYNSQPEPTFSPPLCVGINNCSGPTAVQGALGSATTTSTGAQVRLGINSGAATLVLDTGSHTSNIDGFGGIRFLFDNATTLGSFDTSGNFTINANLTTNGVGTSQIGTTSAAKLGLGVVPVSAFEVLGLLGNTSAQATSNIRMGNNSGTPTVLWDDTHNTYEIDVVNGTGWRFVLNEASTPATLSSTGLLTLGGSIIPTLTTDSGQTATRTVCQDTTSSQLYFGSGAAGVCKGTSSIRFKHDIRPLDVGLAQIMKLQPVEYRYNEGYGDPNKDLYGFTAEQGKTALPKLASETSFDYLGVVPVLVKALQEQQAEIEALKARLK